MTPLHDAYGWRVVRIHNAKLISPYTSRRITLPSNGLIEDDDGIGIHFYPATVPAEWLRAKVAPHEHYAVTFGIALGWIAPDHDMERVLRAKRTNRFRVRMVFAGAEKHAELKANYPDIPVWSFDSIQIYQKAAIRALDHAQARALTPTR